jgi:MoaA/NifB/PqqE/SkfB family radical SAM enzyme
VACTFCYNRDHSAGISEELTTEEYLSVISESFDLGARTILFTGGEPLLRSDIFELMEFSKRKGMYVCLATNGLLVNERISDSIRRLADKVNIGSGGVFMDDLNSPLNDKFQKNIKVLS